MDWPSAANCGARNEVPILILTARDTDFDHVIGLEAGADDYVMKPVDPMVLLARVRALLRRAGRGGCRRRTARRTCISARCASARPRAKSGCTARPVPLTTQEFELLSLLARRAGELVSRDEVFRSMRGIDYDGLDRSIDGRVSKLRRKLGDDAAAPTRIKTVWGKGYLLVPDAWEVEHLKEWLAAGERGLFIRSYVVLAGGLLIVAILLDLGFGALQARQVRVADPWLVSTMRLMENDLAGDAGEARQERAAELGRQLGLELDLLESGDISSATPLGDGAARAGR